MVVVWGLYSGITSAGPIRKAIVRSGVGGRSVGGRGQVLAFCLRPACRGGGRLWWWVRPAVRLPFFGLPACLPASLHRIPLNMLLYKNTTEVAPHVSAPAVLPCPRRHLFYLKQVMKSPPIGGCPLPVSPLRSRNPTPRMKVFAYIINQLRKSLGSDKENIWN